MGNLTPPEPEIVRTRTTLAATSSLLAIVCCYACGVEGKESPPSPSSLIDADSESIAELKSVAATLEGGQSLAMGDHTNQREVTFTFELVKKPDETAEPVPFLCSVDQAPYEPCRSPHTVANLQDGPHTLSVRLSEDPPTEFSWWVDTIPPVFDGLKELLTNSDQEVELLWEGASDEGTAFSDIVFEICVSPIRGACARNFIVREQAGGDERTIQLQGIEVGADLYFLVRARDRAGNRDANESELARRYLRTVLEIAVGEDHSCAMNQGGSVKCWGSNSSGELGDGTSAGSAFPVDVLELSGAVEIEGGWDHSCAVLESGKTYCWGDNVYGQLGDGTTRNAASPVPVSGIDNAVSLGMGQKHTCALLSTGEVKCWGLNDFGQLGDKTFVNSHLPVLVSNLTNAAAISGGRLHNCALQTSGSVVCWGLNDTGQAGGGVTSQPATVPGMVPAIDVQAGQNHSCAVLAGGTVACWGSNDAGQLGNGFIQRNSDWPVTVEGISGAVAVGTGENYSCAILAQGSAWCWGGNDRFQLGDGTQDPTPIPRKVPNVDTAVDLAVGGKHVCVLLSNGQMKCWGWGSLGQIGHGRFSNPLLAILVRNNLDR